MASPSRPPPSPFTASSLTPSDPQPSPAGSLPPAYTTWLVSPSAGQEDQGAGFIDPAGKEAQQCRQKRA